MAIQIPNPGTGNGATGDNEFVLWSKVKDNFSDQSNAASRLVGGANGNLVEMKSDGMASTGWGGNAKLITGLGDIELITKSGLYGGKLGGDSPDEPWYTVLSLPSNNLKYGHYLTFQTGLSSIRKIEWTRYWREGIEFTVSMYHTGNTTLDGNGALKPSSPVLQVFSDCITGNDDGDAMGATYTKNGVGDYTITGTTGLRTDGWYVVIPNDMNGNPKVAITLDDTDGVITLKTYVRIFDMSTFKFVPDLEQPLDIPDGRWIDLRFNDLPEELIPQEV